MTDRPAGGRRLALLLAAAAAAVAIAFIAATLLGGPGRQTATGTVDSVQATSLTNVEGFVIRLPDGTTMAFRVGRLENAATFAPGHLAEHKISLQSVRVTYVDEGGAHVAVRIEDAP